MESSQEIFEEYPLSKIAVSSLQFDSTNPNKPTREQIAAVKRSFRRFGYLVPIIVNENMQIGDGEHRALIYKEMGLQTIPGYIVPKINDDIERRLLRQTMNKLRGEHDIKLDADEIALIFQNDKLEHLSELIAQDRRALEQILTKEKGIAFGHEDFFDVAKTLEQLVPETQLGDMWQLGEHKIICADNSDERSVKNLLEGVAEGEERKADLVFTDPPYNIMGSSTGMTKNMDDNMVKPFFRDIMRLIRKTLKFDGHGYVFCNWRSYPIVINEARAVGLSEKNCIVWHKPNVRLGNMYVSSHEFIFFLANEDQPKRLNPSVNERTVRTIPMSESNVWTLGVDTTVERKHFAEKPIAICARAVVNSSDEGELCFDPFLGSGSTLIACEQNNRICYGVEIDPHYVDVSIKRWEAYTGKKAIKL